MHQAVRSWAAGIAEMRPDVVRIGYIGSYARGDWGVGSDLDLVVVGEADELPFITRAAAWDLSQLPVPADLLVYARAEYRALLRQGSRFARVLAEEAIWVYSSDGVE